MTILFLCGLCALCGPNNSVHSWLIPCRIEKNRSKKAKMRVNPAVFLEKQGDIREKRRKFELKMQNKANFIEVIGVYSC